MQDVHWNVPDSFPTGKKKLLITCHFPGLARREDIPGSPAGAAQTFLSSLTNVRRKTPKQGCGPLCDFPSITPSLPPFFYHLSLLWRLDLPQGAPLKLIRSITHLLIINWKDPRAQSCQEGGGDRSVGGFYKTGTFQFSLRRGEREDDGRTEKRLGAADKTLQRRVIWRQTAAVRLLYPLNDWRKTECVWLFSDCPAPICLFSRGIHTWPHQTPIKNEANLKRIVQ